MSSPLYLGIAVIVLLIVLAVLVAKPDLVWPAGAKTTPEVKTPQDQGPPPQPQRPPPPPGGFPQASLVDFVEVRTPNKSVTQITSAAALETFLGNPAPGMLIVGWNGCPRTREQLGVVLSDDPAVASVRVGALNMPTAEEGTQKALNLAVVNADLNPYTGTAPYNLRVVGGKPDAVRLGRMGAADVAAFLAGAGQ